MTYFPRRWPGILSLNCENPVELHYERLESNEYAFDEDVAISSRENTRQVWTNIHDMTDERDLRAVDPEYLAKKIHNRQEKERQWDEYKKKLNGPNAPRSAAEAAVIAPPPGRSLTFPPWRVPVQILVATKTNPPLAPRGRTDSF
jgi:hypothetical protein